MTRKTFAFVSCAVAAAFMVGRASGDSSDEKKSRVFEIRTYTAAPGKLDALQARFRDHTLRLFEKHGMTNVGYWTPLDEPKSQDTLIYVLAHDSREAAKASFAAFGKDPDWQKARADSEVDGKLTTNIESLFVAPTDYSPLR